MTARKRKRKPDAKVPKVPPKQGEQAKILAATSDERERRPELARDRQPKPADAPKLKRSMKSEGKRKQNEDS